VTLPALAFRKEPVTEPRRPLSPAERAVRNPCLCDSCCSAMPWRARLRRQQRRELQQRLCTRKVPL
jgi:hypothetical protein